MKHNIRIYLLYEILSPLLFNLYEEEAIKKMKSKKRNTRKMRNYVLDLHITCYRRRTGKRHEGNRPSPWSI